MTDPDDLPRARRDIVLGEALDAESVDDLKERIERLKAEIDRVEQALAQKQSGRAAAEAFFRQ